MATQLRAVPIYQPVSMAEIATTLDDVRDTMFDILKDAEDIEFAFGGTGVAGALRVVIKTSRREARETMIFRMLDNMVPGVRFSNIREGVETGARRRLTITAEVR